MMKLKMSIPAFVANLTGNLSGTTAATVLLHSPVKMNKTGNPFLNDGIYKSLTLNGIIGYIYANAVNRMAAKEGKDEREVKPHAWGDMDEKHLFRIHRKTGERYLSMKVQGTKVHGYFKANGEEVSEAELKPYLPKEGEKSSTQADLEGEVIARDYALKNIQWVRVFGNELVLADGQEVPVVEKVAEPA